MAEIENITNSDAGENNVDMGTNNYIEAIKEMKAKSVSRDAYDKLMADNKALLDAMINGGNIELPQEPAPEPVDIQKLRNKLFSTENDLNNLEYAKTALEFRNAMIDQKGIDPFLPMGAKISPTAEDVQGAEKLATALQSCIDYADGDSQLFTQELMRITKK